MKALFKFSASVAVSLLCFALFTLYVLSNKLDFGNVCALPIVCG